MTVLVPARIAGRWVLPALSVRGDQLVVTVAIALDEPVELPGNAMSVQVRTGPVESLARVSGPDPTRPLRYAVTGAASAQAEFVFDNPAGRIPTTIIVTLDGRVAEFDTADVAPVVRPSSAPPAPTVTRRTTVLRVDDLLNLAVDAVNLRLDSRDRDRPVLVAADDTRPALLIVHFPPQTIVEEAYFESGGTEQKTSPGTDTVRDPTLPPGLPKPGAPGTTAARLGGETRLVFRVPAGAAVPYTTAGLLDWSDLELVVSPVADVPPDAEPPVSALTIRAPEPTETTLQLPYRLHLSPTHGVAWDHATDAVTRRGRTELWHTRLALPTVDGPPSSTDDQHPVPLRAIWSPDYRPDEDLSPGDPGAFGALAPMSGYDRDQIVVLTAAFRGYAADPYTPYVPRPIRASLLMLSALGGWLRSIGVWEPPYRIASRPWPTAARLADELTTAIHGGQVLGGQMYGSERFGRKVLGGQIQRWGPRYLLGRQLDLSQWAHVAAQGRDHYVRIVYEGRLKELGHRASLVKVTERRFESTADGPVAYLRQYMYIVVREPEKDYERDGLAQGGRGMPLKKVRLTTLVTPHIDYPYPDPSNPTNDPTRTSYNPAAITDRSFWVMVDGHDFLFHGTSVDGAGHTVDFAKALVFVPNSEQNLGAVHTAFNHVDNRDRRAALVPGQKVTFAPALAGNDNTAFVATSLNLENESATPDGFFKPRLFKAAIRIPAIEQLTGADALTTIQLSTHYLDHGLDHPDNRTGAFAEVVTQDAAGELKNAGLPVRFGASQAGGFATPALDITSLTRGAGPLGGPPAQALANAFDPAQVFPKGLAKLFGVFDLADLLPTGGADQQAPRMRVTRDGTAILTTLDWTSTVKPPTALSTVVAFVRHDDTRLTVRVVARKDLAAAATDSSTLTGDLNHFSIQFFKVLQVNISRFRFAAENGRKTDVNVSLDSAVPVEFQGDLAFVEGLRKLIPPGVFGDGVSIDLLRNPVGIRAGIGISLPPATVGVFALQNIAFSAGLTIPFADGKPVVEFGFARRDNPFLLAVALLGGGGFFHLELDTDGIRMLEAAFEFGAVAAIDIGVASGEVHIMAGIYFKMEKKAIPPSTTEQLVSSLTGFLRCGGRLSVLGLVTLSVEFYLCFTYIPEQQKATGRATLTVEIEIACFSKSIELTVERSFGSEGGDPTFGQLMDSPSLWAEYAGAFA